MGEQMHLWSGRMSPESSTPRTTPSGASSEPSWGWMKPLKLKQGAGLRQAFSLEKPPEWVGESSTPNTSGSPSAGGASSLLPRLVNLSEVLERGPVHPRFSLSARAAQGILRRSERRGKRLPELLDKALRQVAGGTADK